MKTGESYSFSLKKGQVLRYSNNILAGKWQIKSNCPKGLDTSRAEQIFLCTHIIQVLCITQRALHFISFQMFCSALVSHCIDVYFSNTYHRHCNPLSCSQSLRSSLGTLPMSLSSVPSSVRRWDSPLWGDRAGGVVPPSGKLFVMLSGIVFSRCLWSSDSIPGKTGKIPPQSIPNPLSLPTPFPTGAQPASFGHGFDGGCGDGEGEGTPVSFYCSLELIPGVWGKGTMNKWT